MTNNQFEKMMTNSVLFTGYLKLKETTYYGPVSSEDLVTFHWVNKSSGDDYYFLLRKHGNEWFQVEGVQEIRYPEHSINGIGNQIDEWLIINSKD